MVAAFARTGLDEEDQPEQDQPPTMFGAPPPTEPVPIPAPAVAMPIPEPAPVPGLGGEFAGFPPPQE